MKEKHDSIMQTQVKVKLQFLAPSAGITEVAKPLSPWPLVMTLKWWGLTGYPTHLN